MAARAPGREHAVLFSMHHVVSDGWSMGILIDELSRVYGALSAGGASSLSELQVQYADFAAWQSNEFPGEALDVQVEYWSERLRGAPLSLEMPTEPTLHVAVPMESPTGYRRGAVAGPGACRA